MGSWLSLHYCVSSVWLLARIASHALYAWSNSSKKVICTPKLQRLVPSSKLWSSQLWTQFKQLRIEAWKRQDFKGVWTRDLAILMQRSNQLSKEATDVESWSFVSSNEPVKNGCEVIYEMFHMLNCGFWKQVSYDYRCYERTLRSCV